MDPKLEQNEEENNRPPTAFNIFIHKKMNDLKILHPDWSNVKLMSKATDLWAINKKIPELEKIHPDWSKERLYNEAEKLWINSNRNVLNY